MQAQGACRAKLTSYPSPICKLTAARWIVGFCARSVVPETRIRRLRCLANLGDSNTVPNGAPPPERDSGPAGNQGGPPQRLLGVDYGTSYTGIALGRGGVSSALKAISTPRTAKLSDIARQVLAAALQHGVEAVMVGIPVAQGGSILKPHTDSAMGHKCRNLAHTLALMGREHGLSVYLFDERNTTKAAIKGMGYNWQERLSSQDKQASMVDAESAAMLLRLYYGNPRLAVRVNPRVVIKRKDGDTKED